MAQNVLRLKKRAYVPEALEAAGVPSAVVRTMIASGPRAVPERPMLSVDGRKRAKQPTTHYVWGPDVAFYLGRG